MASHFSSVEGVATSAIFRSFDQPISPPAEGLVEEGKVFEGSRDIEVLPPLL